MEAWISILQVNSTNSLSGLRKQWKEHSEKPCTGLYYWYIQPITVSCSTTFARGFPDAAQEKNGKTVGALQSFWKAVEENGLFAGIVLGKKGGHLASLGKYKEALDAYEQAEPVVTSNDLKVRYSGSGDFYFLQENYSAAKAAFNQAICSDPDYVTRAHISPHLLKAAQILTDEDIIVFEQVIQFDSSGERRAIEFLEQLNAAENSAGPLF